MEIQDALLSIMSIFFPLIAGFLTFGRDTLKSLQKKIDKINHEDQADIGDPVTDTDKAKIRFLKKLSGQFIDIVISTFFVSFILIVLLLTAKFNDYSFGTDKSVLEIGEFFKSNWFGLISKIVFFYLIFTMLFNTVFLTLFITRVTQNDQLID